ncbi:hypothetical protein LIA77_04457 [Sarocladium implicatum]|nr:hypothetical protein LIA77_04457 [Sarocladium implicatum]
MDSMVFSFRRTKATKIPNVDHPPPLGPKPQSINLNVVKVEKYCQGKRGYGVFATVPLSKTDTEPFIFELPMYSFLKEVGPRQSSLSKQWAISEPHLRDDLKQHFPELGAAHNSKWSPWRRVSFKRCERRRRFKSARNVKHIYRLASQVARGCSKCANVRAKVDKQCPNIISVYPLRQIFIGDQIILLTNRRPMFYELCSRNKFKARVRSLSSKVHDTWARRHEAAMPEPTAEYAVVANHKNNWMPGGGMSWKM